MRTIGQRLQEAMRAKGVSQTQLSEDAGLSQAAISEYVNDKKRPPTEKGELLARRLEISPQWLYFGAGKGPAPNLDKQRAEYREKVGWGFRPAPRDGGRDFGNPNLFSFRPRMKTIAMETLQNPKDQALDGEMAEVVYRLSRVTGADLECFLETIGWHSELKPRFQQIAEKHGEQKIGRRIGTALSNFDEKELFLLSISDYNTTGLTGEENARGHFTALCRNNLDSVKDEGASRGGTFGLGKAAYWIASELSLVFFNSDLHEPTSDGHQWGRVFGRCELTWHELGEQQFAGPGWFGIPQFDDEDTAINATSVWDNAALARDLFLERESDVSGTTILVVGFRDPSADQAKDLPALAAELEQAVAESFWPAIVNESLRVRIEVAEGRDVVRKSLVDPSRYVQHYVEAYKAYRVGNVGRDFNEGVDVVQRSVALDVPARVGKSGVHPHEGILLVRLADDADANKIVYFRGSEMIVREDSTGALSVGAKPYYAVVMCGKAAGDTEADLAAEDFLRTAEPPSHDDWLLTQDVKDLYAYGAGARIKELFDRTRVAIRELVRPNYAALDDGPQYLKQLLRLKVSEPPPPKPKIDIKEASLTGEAWDIVGELRMRPDFTWRVTPSVTFVGEKGGGRSVRNRKLEAVSNCRVDGDSVVLERGTRKARIRIVTDEATHPISSLDAAIELKLRHIQKIG